MPVRAHNNRPKSFTCDQCGQVLSRQDHLERHRATAHNDTSSQNCACSECGRKFSRSDVLLRHYRVLHGIHCKPRPKGRPKKHSSGPSIPRPVKATGDELSPRPPGDDGTSGHDDDASLTRRDDVVDRNQRHHHSTDLGLTAVGDDSDTISIPRSAQRPETASGPSTGASASAGPASAPVTGPGATVEPPWDIPGLGTSTSMAQMQATTQNPPPPNFANDGGFNIDFADMFSQTPFPDIGSSSFLNIDSNISLLGWMNAIDPSCAYSGPLDLSMTDPSLLDLDDPFRPSSMPPTMSNLSLPTVEAHESTSTTFTGTSLLSPHTSHEPGATPSFIEAPDPVSMDGVSDTWPYEHASGNEQRIAFPQLQPKIFNRVTGTRIDGMSSIGPNEFEFLGSFEKINEEKRLAMIKLLSLPLARVPWKDDVALLKSIPGPEVLHHFTDLYFLHFHELWPIIHQPTFRVSEAPALLVLSMACIGACYSGLEHSIEFSDALAEMCRRTTTWMGEYDPRFLRSPSYGISLLLQHIYSLGSGSRRLFEMTDSSRSRLASIGRQLNLANLHTTRADANAPKRDVFQSWFEWTKKEQMTRLVWFLFEFDCLYTAFSRQPPCIKIDELPLELPCDQLHWDAPTAFAWAACPYETSPRGQPAKKTIHELLTSDNVANTNLAKLDPLSKRLVLRWIGRNVEDCQFQIDSPLYDVLWENNGGRSVALSVKSRLSRAIMSVYESTWANHPRRYTLRQALRIGVACHYSHMFAACKIVDLVTRVARRRAAEPASSVTRAIHPITTTAAMIDESSIVASFAEDPQGIREMAWHASQVFYVQRRHPFNSPHEPLSVFLAGISLWAFTKYFFPYQASNHSGSSSLPTSPVAITNSVHGVSIQLDEPSFRSSSQARQAVQDWIRAGGKTYLEGVGDVQSPGAPRRVLHLSVDMTRRLKVWKMASTVSDIFVRLLQREDQDLNESVAEAN